MIFYTQYCLISVFICVNSLLAPFRSRWFHLQTSEMELFVTITIANVRFYWTMMLHVQFLPMNFLSLCQFIDASISLQAVPACSRWFQLFVGGFSSFQVVLAHSMWFQLVLRFSMYNYFLPILNFLLECSVIQVSCRVSYKNPVESL